MATVNLTIRVDEGTKKDFDSFCNNVGINATAAVNMFIKNVVRTHNCFVYCIHQFLISRERVCVIIICHFNGFVITISPQIKPMII